MKENIFRGKQIFKKNNFDYMLKKFKEIVVYTYLWGLLAHGFAYFNLLYSHDSLMISTTDQLFQVSLGRYLEPLYIAIRGKINAPWLCGAISLFFLSISLFFLLDLFQISERHIIILVSGIGTINVTLICLNATYITWSDVYMLSLLLAILAVWLICKFRYGFIPSTIILAMSLAIYQSYLSVFTTIAIIKIVKELINGSKIKTCIINCAKYIICAFVASLIYLLGLVITLKITGIQLSSGYNGLSSVGDYSNVSIFELLLKTYRDFFGCYTDKNICQNEVSIVINIVIFLLIAFFIMYKCYTYRVNIQNILLIIGCLFLIPFSVNLVYFIAKGFSHELMKYSYVFISVMPFLIDNNKEKKGYLLKVINIIAFLCVIILIFNNIKGANQIYTKKALISQSTQNMVSRMFGKIEDCDGYVPGETPICFIGSLDSNKLFIGNYSDFDGEKNLTGAISDVAITYPGTEFNFFKYYLNMNIPIIYGEEKEKIISQINEEVMPSFPQKNFCKMINGIMIVKLSDLE